MVRNENDHFGLLFDIQRSIRYHDRRAAHYDFWHKITNVLTILLSGVVMLEVLHDSPFGVKIVAAFAGALGAIDLVVGFSHQANVHREFKRRFCVLEQQMHDSTTQDHLDSVRRARSEIEAEEPPIFRGLDAVCHNELCAAHGFSRSDPEEKRNYHEIPRHVRLTANYCRWPDIAAIHH